MTPSHFTQGLGKVHFRRLHKRCLPSLAGFFIMLVWAGSNLAWADDSALNPENGARLAAKNRCISCHHEQRKVVGPAFVAITQRFANQAQAQSYLVKSILEGSQGRWGPIPMPRQTHVSDADANALAAWILSLKASK
ncbi:MAG TPA: c-type cytochrome [Burkholderiaceae bacterium]|nr:c-type cytochrome [Burkholderiaceae bacterium]